MGEMNKKTPEIEKKKKQKYTKIKTKHATNGEN